MFLIDLISMLTLNTSVEGLNIMALETFLCEAKAPKHRRPADFAKGSTTLLGSARMSSSIFRYLAKPLSHLDYEQALLHGQRGYNRSSVEPMQRTTSNPCHATFRAGVCFRIEQSPILILSLFSILCVTSPPPPIRDADNPLTRLNSRHLQPRHQNSRLGTSTSLTEMPMFAWMRLAYGSVDSTVAL